MILSLVTQERVGRVMEGQEGYEVLEVAGPDIPRDLPAILVGASAAHSDVLDCDHLAARLRCLQHTWRQVAWRCQDQQRQAWVAAGQGALHALHRHACSSAWIVLAPPKAALLAGWGRGQRLGVKHTGLTLA